MDTKEKFIPYGKRILILVDEQPTETPSGIYMATKTEDHPDIKINHGTIIGIGATVKEEYTDSELLEPGMRIVYNKYAALKVWPTMPKLSRYLVIEAQDVLGILKPSEE